MEWMREGRWEGENEFMREKKTRKKMDREIYEGGKDRWKEGGKEGRGGVKGEGDESRQ